MPKSDLIEVEGVVDTEAGGGFFFINTQNGRIKAKLAGKMRKNHIRVIEGDTVKVAVSPYDMTHGLITYRSKK